MEKNDFLQRQALVSKEAEKTLKQLIAICSDVLAEEESYTTKMMSKQALKEHHQAELILGTHIYKKRLESGMVQLIQAMGELGQDNSTTLSNAIAADIASMVSCGMNMDTAGINLIADFKEGKSIQKICGMSDTTLNLLYRAAKYLYDQQHYVESADAFAVLCMINSEIPLFWIGLANSEYFCYNYEQALYAYAIGYQMDPLDPTCHIASSKCYEELREIDNAINSLDLALVVMEDSKEFKEQRVFALEEKERLQKLLQQ